MVVKIMKAAGSVSHSLSYNESKVEEGLADVICTANVDRDMMREEFARLEKRNFRSSQVSFHMTVNPGPGEELTDSQASSLVGELMAEMGYGDQPYVIYRHNDIEREHFHVVSIRIREDGRKIGDRLEWRRCREALERLAPSYGYTVGSTSRKQLRDMGIDPRRFNPDAGNVKLQIEAIFQEVLKYRMVSWRQFSAVMRAHGLSVTERPGKERYMLVRGLDREGRPCTRPLDERSHFLDMSELFEVRRMQCLKTIKTYDHERYRISHIVNTCMPAAVSREHFMNMLAKMGISCHMEYDGMREVKALTFVDRTTRCAFSAQELMPRFQAARFVEMENRNLWGEDRSLEKAADVAVDILSGLSTDQGEQLKTDPNMKDRRRNARRRGVHL